jgi:putative addiction module killer protein
MEAKERNVRSYKTTAGTNPYREWRDRITSEDVLAAVLARQTRLSIGNFGDSEAIGEGASESKIDLGPGYRIYYGVDGEDVILLCGGNKSTQTRDIERAIGYWKDYKAQVRVWKNQQATKKGSS